MTARGPLCLLLAVLLLTLGAGISLGLGDRQDEGQAAHMQDFQELTGGLGFGPATDLSQDITSFDPRLGPRSSGDLGPLPAGGAFYSGQACSIFAYPPLPREQPAWNSKQ